MTKLRAPFWWFGGKSRIAPTIWQHFGTPQSYIEPFAGSLAVLLAREHPQGLETVNDIDGHVVNVWRSISQFPHCVAELADWPTTEIDLIARNEWLIERRQKLVALLKHDPHYCDPKAAAWWLWGHSNWIAGGFCHGQPEDWSETEPQGLKIKLPKLDDGNGVVPMLRRNKGELNALLVALAGRLRNVRVACGDWTRVLAKAAMAEPPGITAVFLDPPYDTKIRACGLYASDKAGLSDDVRSWAIEHGEDPGKRIILCGYSGEHNMPGAWRAIEWKALGGFGNRVRGRGWQNSHKERLWLSPACL